MVGKGYDTGSETGQLLWQQVSQRLQAIRIHAQDAGPALIAAARFGSPTVVLPRLGQGSFRVLITEAYTRRCAVTGERTLPVLEATHIRPYARGGPHELSNGLLLRSDLHTLFDRGYIGIDPKERRVLISSRIKEEFENGKDYYSLHGRPITPPVDEAAAPQLPHLRV